MSESRRCLAAQKGDEPDDAGRYPSHASKDSGHVLVFYSGDNEKQSGNNKTGQAGYLVVDFFHPFSLLIVVEKKIWVLDI